MKFKYEPLAGKHRRYGLATPISWIIFWLLVFEHAPWIPQSARVVALTLLFLLWIILWITWFEADDERELLFLPDGTVKWRFPKEDEEERHEKAPGDTRVQAN